MFLCNHSSFLVIDVSGGEGEYKLRLYGQTVRSVQYKLVNTNWSIPTGQWMNIVVCYVKKVQVTCMII